MQETQVQFLGWEDNLAEGNGYSLQYSCLENSTNKRAWWTTVHGVAESDVTEQLTHPMFSAYTSTAISSIF